MKVVTAGPGYMDIGCVAYAELLNLQGEEAIAASTATLNESITPTIRTWQTGLVTDYKPQEQDEFILIDVSDPKYFDTFVNPNKIGEIIDHHPQFEQYWQERLGQRSHIEFIGAACTLVYERWEQAGLVEKMSVTSAKLLTAGILDNTLNFQANVSTPRDKIAYAELAKIANLPETFPAEYFSECQKSITQDIAGALRNDTKTMVFPTLGRSICVGQLVVWDATDVIAESLPIIEQLLRAESEEWFTNVVSISEGKSYLVADNATVQAFLSTVLDVQFHGSVAPAQRLWLRKEIAKQDMQVAQKKGDV